MTRHDKVERLPVTVSSNGVEKLLGVPKCVDGTGKNIAKAVYHSLNEWNLTDQIQGMCFDTTSTNTGNIKGACLFLEELFGRKLSYFACRHHIYEIVLRQVFETKFGKTKGPDVPIFERFKKDWNKFDLKKTKSGIYDKFVKAKIGTAACGRIKKYCVQQLLKSQCRADYKEFLELVLLFLGQKPPTFTGIYRPGPSCHARWMVKAINTLKMFLLREQIEFNSGEFDGLRDVSIFIVTMYVEAWFGCPNGVEAAQQDLQFIKNAIKYSKVDRAISDGVLNKMSHHLWYLSEDLIGLAFFDRNVSAEEKRKMVNNLHNKAPNSADHRIRVADSTDVLRQTYGTKSLSDFVTIKTAELFDRFSIPMNFLKFEPSTWLKNSEYIDAYKICSGFHVTNDTAERGVKLMTDFNSILAKREDEKQFILQVVEEYRRKYPSANKSTLVSSNH